MADQRQDPPKEKVDLFDVLHTAHTSDPNFDPGMYAYMLNRDSRQGKFTIVPPDSAAIAEKYGNRPEYQGPEGQKALQGDIAFTRDFHDNQLSGVGRYKQYYRPPVSRAERIGLLPPPGWEQVSGHVDPYVYHGPDGAREWARPDEDARGQGYFFDRTSEKLPLTGKDLDERAFKIVYEPYTDADGNNLQKPVLRELKYGEAGYGSQIMSKWGSKPESGTWVGSGLKSIYNNLSSGIATPIAAAIENTVGQTSIKRLRTLAAAWDHYNLPTKAMTSDNLVERGIAYPMATPNILPDEYESMTNEKLFALVEQLKQNEDALREAASNGDAKSKVGVDILDLADGVLNKGTVERWANTMTMLDRVSQIPQSYQRDRQGMFGGGEAIADIIGQGIGQLGPQALATRGLASLAVKAGLKGLVRTSVQEGMSKVLTGWGQKAVALGGATVPSFFWAKTAYQGARDIGYSNEEAMWLASRVLPLTLVSEGALGSNYMMRKYLAAGGSEKMRDLIASTLRRPEAAANKASKFGKAVSYLPGSEHAGKLWSQATRINDAFTKWIARADDSAFMAHTKGTLDGFRTEFLQEGGERMMEKFLEDMLDQNTGEYRYEKSRGPGYSYSNDIWSNALAGGIMGSSLGLVLNGGKPPVQPFDRTIAAEVAAGNAGEVLKTAQRMRTDGMISPEEFSTIEQDVALSDQIMRGMSVSDPHFLQYIQGNKDLTEEYASRSMDMRARENMIKELSGKLTEEGSHDKVAIQNELTGLQEKQKEDQKIISEILDGTETLRRLKNSAMSLASVRGGDGLAFSTETVDALSESIRAYVASEQERIKEGKPLRGQLTPMIGQKLNDLVGMNPKQVFEGVNELNKLYDQLGQKRALTKEDLRDFRKKIQGKRAQFMQELMEMPWEGAPEGQDLTYAARAAANNENTGQDAEEFVLKTLRAEMMTGEDTREHFTAIEHLSSLEQSFGRDDLDFEANISTHPENKHFDGSATEDLLMDRLKKIPSATGQLYDAGERLRKYKSMKSATAEDLQELQKVIAHMEMHSRSLDAYRGPLSEMAERVNGSELQRIVSAGRENAVPKAFKELDLDNNQVYQTARRVAPEKVAEVKDLLFGLKKEGERLKLAVEQRSKRLAILDEKNLAIEHRLVDMYFKARTSEKENKDLTDAYVAFVQAMEKKDLKEADKMLARVRALVSKELIENKDSAGKVVASMLAPYGLTGTLSEYWDASWTMNSKFDDWYSDAIFEKGPDWVASMDKGGITLMVTNWVNELVRTDHATVLHAFNGVIASMPPAKMVPNSEQQRQVLHVASFLNNPSQDITDDLLRAGHSATSKKLSWNKKNYAMERSILFAGAQGVGKSASVPFIVETLSKLKGRALNIAIFTPGTQNRVELSTRIKEVNAKHTVHTDRIDQTGRISKFQDLDLVIVDEAHTLSPQHAEMFKKAMRENGVTPALFIGDHNQVPSLSEKEFVLPVQKMMVRTLPLTTSFRHGDVESIALMDYLEDIAFPNIYESKSEFTLPATEYSEGYKAGVRLIDTDDPNDVIDEFAQHIAQGGHLQVALIVLDEEARSAALARLSHRADLIAKVPPQALENMVKVMDAGDHSILGGSVGTAFIAFSGKDLGPSYARFLYTAIGRAENSSVVLFRGGRSQKNDKLPKVATDQNSMGSMWAAQKERAKVLSDSAGPPVNPPAPPARDFRIKDPKYSNGAEVYLKTAFLKSEDGKAFKDYAGKKGLVVETGRAVRVDFGGNIVEVPEKHLQSNSTAKVEKKPKLDDTPPEPFWREGDMLPETTWGLHIPASDTDVDLVTRLSMKHSPSQRWVGAFPGTLPFDPAHEQFSKDNPAYAWRLKILELVGGNAKTRVKLIWRKNGEYYNPAGAKGQGPAFEIHLTEDSKPLLETARKRLKLKQLPPNATMLGSLAISTIADKSSLAGELRGLHDLSGKLEDGQTPKGYESLPISMWLEGLYIKPAVQKGGAVPSIPVSTLIDNLKKKGWLVSDPQFAHDAWQYTAGDKRTKMPGVFVEVRAFDGAPATRVLLKTKNADADYYQELTRDIDQWNNKASDGKTLKVEEAERSLGYKFLQWNRARLMDNGAFRNPELDQFLEVRTDTKTGVTHPNFKSDRSYTERLADLRSALEILQKSDRSLTQVVTLAKEATGSKGFDKIHPDDIGRMLSEVTDVHMPVMFIGMDGVGVIKSTDSVPAMSLFGDLPTRRKAKSGTGSEGNRRRAIDEVENYYRKVFGNKWVDGQLEFKDTVTDEFGRELWGRMENGRIALERSQGTIAAGTERHEAVHRVLDYLLDKQTMRRFIDEAKEKLSEKKGIRYWQVSDEDAHEFIAEQYENPTYETTTLFGRFMRWLKGVFKRWGIYRDTIDDLLWQIEEGRFRDAEELYSNPVTRHSRKKLDEDDRSQLSLFRNMGDAMEHVKAQQEESAAEKQRISGFKDRMALKTMFGGAAAEMIVAEAAYNLTLGGPYQHTTDGSMYLSLPSIKAAVDQYWSLIKDAASRRDPYVIQEDGSKLPFEEIPVEQLVQMSPEVFSAYRLTKMAMEDENGNRPVFASVVQAVLPGIDVERLLNDEAQVDHDGDYHTDMDALEGMSAMVHDTNDQLRPFDRASGLTKLLLSNMRLINYGEDRDGESGGGELANVDLLLKVGYKAAQGVVYGHKPGESLQQTFARKLLDIHKADFVKVKGEKDRYQPTTEGRHAYSLYKRFLDPDGHFISGTGHKTFSYAYLQEQAERLRSETTGTAQLEALNARIAMAKRVNNNVVRSLIEVSTANNMLSEFMPGEYREGNGPGQGIWTQGRFRHQLLRFEGMDAVRSEINEMTDRLLVARGSTDIGLDPDMRSKFLVGLPGDKPSPEHLRFQIDSRGVQASDGTWIARYSGKETELATDSIELLQGFFRAAGYPFSISTLERLTKGGLDNDQVKNGLLARAVGAWAAAIHGAIHQVEAGSVPKFAEGIMAVERKRSGVGTKTRADVHGVAEMEEGQGDQPLPAISDFFTLNGKLAQMESRSRGTEYSRRFMNIQGNAEQSDTLGNYFKRLFPALGPDVHSSSIVENIAEELLQRDPALRKGDRWLNPLLDKVATPRITEVFFFKGLRTSDRARANDPRSMTDLDAERTLLDNFMMGIVENWDAERVLVPGHTYGDRNVIPVFRLDNMGGGKRMFLMDKGAKGFASVKFNHAFADKRIAEQFIYHKQLQEQSLQRWSNVLGMLPDVVMAQLASGITDDDLKAIILSSPEMMENRDYKVKGNTILPGNAALMNVGVYTEQNYQLVQQAAGSSETLRPVIDGIFRPHIERYRDTLKGNEEKGVVGLGWSLPSRVRREVPQVDHDQLLEGYVYLQHLVDGWTSQVITGPVQNYKDFEDWTKRSVMAMSPGHLGQFKHQPRMAFVVDPKPAEGGAALFDGQGWTTPWGYLLGREAFGGPEGVMRETVNKRAYVSSDLIVKYAEVLVSPQYYRQNEYVKGLIQRSLMIPGGRRYESLGRVSDEAAIASENLTIAERELDYVNKNNIRDQQHQNEQLDTYNKHLGNYNTLMQIHEQESQPLLHAWNSTLTDDPASFWQAAQAVIDRAEALGMGDQLIHVISSHHNVKMGRRAMNLAESTEPLQSVAIDPRNWVLQTNLERSLMDLRAPYPTQITAIMGLLAHNTERSQRMALLEAAITDRYIQRMYHDIGMDENDSQTEKLRKISSYFKDQGLKATADQGDMGQLVEALMDSRTSVNDPVVKRKLIQVIANGLNTRGINPKLGGQMFNQASGHGLTFALPEEPAADGSQESGGVSQPTDTGDTGRPGSSESGVAASPTALPVQQQGNVPVVTGENGAENPPAGTPQETATAPQLSEEDQTALEAIKYLPEFNDGIFDWEDEYSSLLPKGHPLRSVLRQIAAERKKYDNTDMRDDAHNEEEAAALVIRVEPLIEKAKAIGEEIQKRNNNATSDQRQKGATPAAPTLSTVPSSAPDVQPAGASATTGGDQQAGVPGQSGLRPPRLEGGKYVPGDVIMPFLYAREFGFKGTEWKDLSLEQIREDIQMRLGDEAVKQFEKTLMVYVARTPSSNVSGGHVMMVREFINDSGNTIFVPPDLNNYTGGDQDGDQLSVLVHRFEGGPDNIADPQVLTPDVDYNEASDQERSADLRALQNQLREEMIGYYADEKNAPLAFLQTGTKRLVQGKEEIMAGKAIDPLNRTPLMPMGVIASRRAVFDGSQLIGIVAQAIKGYSFLSQAYNRVAGTDAEDETFDRWVPQEMQNDGVFHVIDNLSELLNGALDNVKLMALGPLGVNPDNIGAVIGSLLYGNTLTEALALASDPEMVTAVARVQRNRSMTLDGKRSKSVTLLDALKDAKNGSLREYAALFEALSDVTRIFNMNVNGMPVEESEILSYQQKVRDTLSGKRALSQDANDQLIASFFNPLKVLSQLPNISGFLVASGKVDDLFRTAFLSRHPVMTETREQAMVQLGHQDSFGGENDRSYENATLNAALSLYINQYFGETPVKLNEDLPEIDLSSSGGMFRYAMEFPRFWENAMARVMHLPESDPRKAELRANTFIEELRVTGGKTPRLEVKDGRRFSDPVARDLVRRDVERLREIFSGQDIMGDWDMGIQERLALYSMIKDRFSYDRHSIMPFLPVQLTLGFGQFLESDVLGNLDHPNGPAAFRINGSGERMTFPQLMQGKFLQELPYHYPDLVLRGKAAAERTKADFWKVQVKKGLQRFWQVHQVNEDPKSLSVPVTSRLAPQFSMVGPGVLPGVQSMQNLDIQTHLELQRGEQVTLNLDRDQSIKPGQLYLPTGAIAEVTEVNDKGRQLKLQIPGASVSGSLDQENPAGFHDLYDFVPRAAQAVGRVGHHGRDNMMMDGLSLTDALKRTSMLSNSPYKTMAKIFLKAQETAERVAKVTVVDAPGGNRNAGGYIDYEGNIQLNKNASALDVDRALMHEAGHRFFMHVLAKSPSALTRAERRYVDGITGIYNEIRAKLPFDDDYYLSSLQEFATGVFTSVAMQEKIAGIPHDAPMGFWQRLVNTLRELLNSFGIGEPVRNGYLSRVMDITNDYLAYSSARGMVYNKGDAGGYFSLGDMSHGVKPDLPPIKDIKDMATHLLTPKDAARNVEEMEFEQLLNHVYSGINWNRSRQTIAGQVIDISDNSVKGKAAILKLLREDVVPRMHGYAHRKKTSMVEVLNKGANWKDWAEAFKGRGGAPIDTEESFKRMLSVIDHQPDNIYLHWSDLSDPGKVIVTQDGKNVKVGELGLKHVPMFQGYDPVISVRKTDQGLMVNLVEFTSENLTAPSATGKIKHLLSNYLPGTMLNNVMKARITNDVGGVRAFLLGLQAMALKQANDAIAFPRVQVVQMNGEGFNNEGIWMPDLLTEIKVMRDHTTLAKQLPDGIRAVINDEKLYDGLAYKQSFTHMYGQWLMRASPDMDNDIHYAHLRMMDAQERYLSSPEFGKKHYRDMLQNRQRMMQERYRKESELQDNEEYILISQALYELDHTDVLGTNSDIDVNIWGKFLHNPANMESDPIQWAQDRIKTSVSKVANLSMRDHNAHIEQIKELEKVVLTGAPEHWMGKVVETGWKRFDNLWRKSTTDKNGKGLRVYDAKTGELVQAELNMIHWDENDPETAELLREGKLTRTELKYANWLLDQIHEKLIELKVHGYRVRMLNTVGGKFNREEALRDARQEVDKQWKRGWIPVVSRGKGEAFMQGQLAQTVKAIGRQAANLDSIYEDDFHKGGTHDPYHVANRYLSELQSLNPSELGSDIRLERMGMKSFADGRIELHDAMKNNASTRNLEAIMTYFTVAAHRQIVHESETLPVVNSALAVMHAMEKQGGKGQENNLAWLKDYARRMVYGEAPPPSGINIFGASMIPATRLLMTATTYGGVALNWKVAAASMMYNNMAFWATARANGLANNGRFGMKSAMRAVKECTVANPKGNKKMRALMIHLFVNEMQEGDALNNERYNRTGSQVFTSHGMQVFNWWGDYMIRGNVMAAQMIEEGSWDAYSLNDKGEVVYDQYKDRRWYNADGTKVIDADIKMKWVRERLRDQGIHDQPEQGPLKVGHDARMGRVFKWLADKYVIGGVDASEKTYANSSWMGQLLLQFRQFLPSKIYNWQGRRIEVMEGGNLTVKDGMAVWEKQEIQSYLGAIIKGMRLLHDSKEMGLRESFKRFDKADQFAIWRFAHDMAIMAAMWMMYLGVKGAADEDKKRRRRGQGGHPLLYDNRVLTMFQQGAFDNVGGSALGLAYTVGKPQSAVPAFSTGYRMWTSILGGNPEKLLDNIPGKKTFDIVADQTDSVQ